MAISEPAAIDPGLSGEVEGYQVVRLLFESLVGLDADLELEPGVADSWEVGEDGVTWTFQLRDTAAFSNGRPVVADDFVYAFARAADPDLAAPASYQGSPILGWDDVAAGEVSGEIGYVEAARASGAGRLYVLVHHVLPNCASITIVSGTTIAGLLIAGEATLTFLGIGVQQPSISWGLMIDDAQRRIGATPHLLIFPTLGLTAVVAAFVLLGDALRDALDPRSA